MSLGERIREKRNAKRLTLQQLGDVFGITRSSVSEWESDRTRPDQAKLVKLAEVLDTTVADLLEEPTQKAQPATHLKVYRNDRLDDRSTAGTERPVGKLPVISWAQARYWGDETMNAIEPKDWVLCPFPENEFVLEVVGQSMFSPGGESSFRDGDYVSVSKKREPRHESLVIAQRDNEQSATFRQLLIESDGSRMLLALNPAWPNRYTAVDEHTEIIGVVTGQWRPVP